MQALNTIAKRIFWWVGSKERRRTVIATVIVIAALASALNTVHDSSWADSTWQSGPLTWFALPTLGVNLNSSNEPEYWKGCIDSNPEYLAGAPVVKAGWPVSFEYDDYAGRDCRSGFYPLPFVFDALVFAWIYLLLALTVPKAIAKLWHSKRATKKRIIFVVITCAVSVLATYETANVVHIAGTGTHTLPILSSVATSSNDIPLSFPLCPSSDITIERQLCRAPWGCALTGISEPSDPRLALQGWPFAYVYTSLDPCFGDTIYPLVFIVDSLLYIGILITLSLCALLLWFKKKQDNIG